MRSSIIKRCTKYSLVATVTIVLLLSQAGLIMWSCIKKASYTYICQHSYDINKLDTITLATTTVNTDLVWLEKDEIQYKGEMFDIKHQYTHNGISYLVGHFDSFEKNLFNVLAELFNDPNKSANSQQSIAVWIFDAILPSFNFIILFNADSCSIDHLLASAPQLLSPFYNKDAVPPEIGC